MIQDPDLARRLGEAGRARVEAEFRADTMIERFAELYETTGAGQGAGRLRHEPDDPVRPPPAPRVRAEGRLGVTAPPGHPPILRNSGMPPSSRLIILSARKVQGAKGDECAAPEVLAPDPRAPPRRRGAQGPSPPGIGRRDPSGIERRTVRRVRPDFRPTCQGSEALGLVSKIAFARQGKFRPPPVQKLYNRVNLRTSRKSARCSSSSSWMVSIPLAVPGWQGQEVRFSRIRRAMGRPSRVMTSSSASSRFSISSGNFA